MEPVFTLQWPEAILADRLQELLPKAQGYSVLIPLSRQEKGFDLAIIKRLRSGKSNTITLQVKASRTYRQELPKREATRRFHFETWFNRFEVPPEADFFLLCGIYAPDVTRTSTVNQRWYKDCTLLFTASEMKRFIASCRTVSGTPDKMFGFGFDENPTQIIQTRGDQKRRGLDFSEFLLEKRIQLIKAQLSI